MRTFHFAADFIEIGADAIVRLEIFSRDTVIATDNAFGAAQIDADPPTNSAGTIAGDDTIFIAARSSGAARSIAERLGAHALVGAGGAA